MLIHEIGAAWQQAQRPGDCGCEVGWSALQAREPLATGSWQAAAGEDLHQAGRWNDVPAQDVQELSRWSRGEAQSQAAASAWNNVPACDLGQGLGWNHSIRPCDIRLSLIYNPKPALKDVDGGQVWQRSDEYGPRYDAAQALQASLYIPGPGPLAFEFGGVRYIPSSLPQVFFDFRYVQAPRAIKPVDAVMGARFEQASALDQSRRVPWGFGRAADPVPTGIQYPNYNGPIYVITPATEPDILETYMIANTVTLVVLPDRIPVEATSIRLGLDIDSFSWSFSAELFGRTALNLVKPDANGQQTVELTINGWTWLLLIERYSRKQGFPAERYSITGSTRTQLLAGPYAPKRTAVNAAPITARQAAEAELQYTGFTLSWDAEALGPPDWTLPAGAFSYQGQTAIQVIARIAEAGGGVVRPARDTDALSVVPRYREAAWNWAASVMDKIIPAAIMTELGGEWTPNPSWNSVYVSGTNYGVAVDVRRAGTAGDNQAPDVYDELMTGTEAARSRGICELSKGGNVEIISLAIPLFPASDSGNPGLVEPAMLCEVREDGDTWRGLCLGTEISADGVGATRVKQTLRLERHH